MRILDAIIRTDEIIGISGLSAVHEGDRFHYCFFVITKSSSVKFCSSIIERVDIATKLEQEELSLFKSKYATIRNEIGLLIGDTGLIVDQAIRFTKAENSFNKITKLCDEFAAIINKHKWKCRSAMQQLLGDVWAEANELKKIAHDE